MIGIIIQARMGSSRLPGKILKPLGGIPLLEFILSRVDLMVSKATVVVATTYKQLDDQVNQFCRERSREVFRGSEDNVLERYLLCSREYGFGSIVRLTGDNPFVDPYELDRLIELHLAGGSEYSSSVDGLPVGVGAEIFSMGCLERLGKAASMPHHYEHVNEYLLENQGSFRVAKLTIPAGKNHPEVRLTVDTENDYRRAQYIADKGPGIKITTEKAISLAQEFDKKCSVSA